MKKNILVLLTAIMLVTTACGAADESGPTEEQTTPVQVATIEVGDLLADYEISGTLSASLELSVTPMVSEQLAELLVERGDHVERGQVLAKLDQLELQQSLEAELSALEQAQIQLESAQIARNKAEQGLNNAQITLKQAELNLKSEDNDSTTDDNGILDNDTIQRQQLEIQYEDAKKNLERMEALYESGDVSLQQYESAVTAEQNAALALQQAQINTQNYVQAREQAEIAVNNAEQDIQQADINIEQAQSSIRQAELRVEQARQRLEDAVITAPSAGEIVEIHADVGEIVSSQTPLFTLVSYDPIILKTTLSAQQLSLFSKGMQVQVDVPAANASDDNSLTGIVQYVSPVNDNTGLYPLEVELPNEDHVLKPGMIATIRVPETLAQEALLVPTTAIVEKAGLSYVYIVEQDHAVLKEVEVLASQTEFSAIEGDVAAGDRVVVKGQITLSDGNRVTIVEDGDTN